MPGRQLAHVLSNFRHCVVAGAAAARSQWCERRSRLTRRSSARSHGASRLLCVVVSFPVYPAICLSLFFAVTRHRDLGPVPDKFMNY